MKVVLTGLYLSICISKTSLVYLYSAASATYSTEIKLSLKFHQLFMISFIQINQVRH